ncbi:DNA cytosine methyltransferase [Methylomagnum ishizawai]|uniref:DNA cytosine methyltransferase n=1 Tax=Methylomagnum ishizawai TaxID=1760988 RepID=UPI001C7EC4B9|nr:DNA (cytosine-5-)-methyltransferase [Methylomagnum ishizawai]
MQKNHYTLTSLFSGIGGFELGFESQGFTTVFQCEKDEFCQKVLEKHWPKIPRANDIKRLDPAIIPVSDVWTAGFPCQDVSLARMGPRAGLKGARTGLFHEFARLLEHRLPRVILLENVHGLLSSHGGRDFELVIRTLAELGYVVGWRVLNSKNFGVPQSRQRVYIVGCYRERSGPGQILFEPERGAGHVAPGGSNGEKSISAFKRVLGNPGEGGPVVQGLAYCLYATSARHTGTDWSRTYVTYPKAGRVRRLLPKECEGIMGFPLGWTDIPVSMEQDEVDSVRYHALGNAVTPPVIAWLAGRIKSYLNFLNMG